MFRKLVLVIQAFILSQQLILAQQQVQTFPDLVVKGEPIISAIAEAGDGGYYLATRIDRINGENAASLTRIDESGNLVSEFQPVFLNNRVYQIQEVSEGKILIAGTFTRVNGLSMVGLVRFNSNGTIDDTFAPLSTTGGSYALSFGVQQSGKVIVCGNFTIGGYAKLVRLNTDGTVDNSFTALPPHDRSLMQVKVDANDNIYINGLSKIFKTNSEGVQQTGFPVETPSGGSIYQIQSHGNKIVAGGYFTTIGGQSRQNLAIVNEDGSIGTFSTTSASSDGRCVVKSNGTIILDQESSTRVFYSDATLGPILTTGIPDGMLVDSEQRLLVAGGYDFKANGVAVPSFIVRFNSDFSIDNSFQCQVSFTAGIEAIQSYPDGRMLIGGNRGVKGIGTTTSRLARINSDGTVDGSFNPQLPDDGIVSLALQGDKVLVCAKSSLKRLTATGALDNTFQEKNVFNWDAFTKVKVFNGKIYLAGAFTMLNGTSAPGIIRLNENGTVDNTFSSPFTGAYVMDFTFQSDGKIIVCGPLQNSSNNFWADLARLNLNGTIDDTFNAGTKSGNGIYALGVDSQDRIYLAGDFAGYNTAASRFARLSANGVLDQTFQPSWPFGESERITTLQVLSDDEIMVGINFFPWEMTRSWWMPKVMAVYDASGNVLPRSWDDFGMNASVCTSHFDGTRLFIAGRIVAEDDHASVSPVSVIYVNYIIGGIAALHAERADLTQVSLSWEIHATKMEELVIERSIGSEDNFQELGRVGPTQTTYIDNSSIDPSAVYYYRVKAVNAISESAYSNIAPAYPALFLNANNPDTASFDLSWNSLSFDTQYKVEVSDNNFETVLVSHVISDKVITIDDLEAYTAYQVRVGYFYEEEYRAAINTLSVTTLPLPPVITGISLSGFNSISLAWTNRFPDAAQIQVFRSLNPTSGFAQVATVNANEHFYVDEALESGSIYYYFLKATSNSVTTGFSNVASETTEILSLEISDLDTVSFRLSWAEPAASGDYKVEISADNFETSESFLTTQTEVVLEGLQPNTAYLVKVSFLYNDVYHPSSPLLVTTLPQAPLLTNLEVLSRRVIELTWFNRFDEATHVEVYRGNSLNGRFAMVAELPSSVNSYRDSSVYGGREYYYKLIALTNTIESPFSNVLTVTTPPLLAQTISFEPFTEMAYRDTTIELTASASSGLDIQFESQYDSVAIVEGNLLTVVGAGDVLISAVQPGDPDFDEASQSRLLRILKADQTLDFNPVTDVIFAKDGDLALEAIASSGLAVTFASDNNNVVEIIDNAAIMKGAGLVTITASQAGTQNFNSVAVSRTFRILKTDQTIDFVDLSDTYVFTDSPIELEAAASSGLEVIFSASDPNIVEINGNIATILQTGTVIITATQMGSTDYNRAEQSQTINITKGTQTIHFADLLDSYSTLQEQLLLDASATSGLTVHFQSSNSEIISIDGNIGIIHKPGLVEITAIQTGNANFSEAVPVVQTVEIFNGTQTITFALEAKVFGDAPFELKATASSGLPVSYISGNETIATIEENILTIQGAGTVAITARQEGNTVFDAVEVTVELTIAKAPQTIDFNIPDDVDIVHKVGDVLTLNGIASSGLIITYTVSNTSIAEIDGDQLSLHHPGNVLITASQNGDANYLPAVPVERIIRVRLITMTEEFRNAWVSVYPNPSQNYFTISTLPCFKNFRILSAKGNQVTYEQMSEVNPTLRLDLSNEPPGVYYLIAEGCDEMIVLELVKF